MKDITVISQKTPKTKRPVTKNEYSLVWALRKTPIVLDKTRKYTIGRLSKNTITLPQKTTSDIHATIKWAKSAFKLTDEKSTNGTYLNGRLIKGITPLSDGDKIRVGKYVIQFHVKKVRQKKTA